MGKNLERLSHFRFQLRRFLQISEDLCRQVEVRLTPKGEQILLRLAELRQPEVGRLWQEFFLPGWEQQTSDKT